MDTLIELKDDRLASGLEDGTINILGETQAMRARDERGSSEPGF